MVALTLLGVSARAETVLRVGSIIPEGTSWARTMRAFAREVDGGTSGHVKIKLYFGGIAGDEMEELDRMRRGQLDGAVSGGMLCERIAPTYRVMRVPGLFQSRDENAYVLTRLKPDLDKEMLEQGVVHMGDAGVGPSIVFSRTPVASMSDLRAHPLWVWDADDPLKVFLPLMGFRVHAAPIAVAAREYDEGKSDGFVTPPMAALGFQWSTQVRYYTDLRITFISGCLVFTSRAYDPLPQEAKRLLVVATARAQKTFEDTGHKMDDDLLGSLFQKQGLKRVPVSESFRAEFFDAARAAREKVTGSYVPEKLVQRVLSMLADFRGSR